MCTCLLFVVHCWLLVIVAFRLFVCPFVCYVCLRVRCLLIVRRGLCFACSLGFVVW